MSCACVDGHEEVVRICRRDGQSDYKLLIYAFPQRAKNYIAAKHLENIAYTVQFETEPTIAAPNAI